MYSAILRRRYFSTVWKIRFSLCLLRVQDNWHTLYIQNEKREKILSQLHSNKTQWRQTMYLDNMGFLSSPKALDFIPWGFKFQFNGMLQ